MKRMVSEKRILMILLFIVAFATLFGFIVMALWNNILVPVVHIGAIGFWQALGILVLSKILFGGFTGRWFGGHQYGRHSEWRKKMSDKWQNMSPEEREKFKQEWKSRCYGWKRAETAEQKMGNE